MRIPEFPTYIMIQTTSLCNACCEFCPYGEIKNELPQGEMDFALFKKIADECGQHQEIKRIMPYLMNEPLMDTKLEEKIDYIKEKNPAAWVHFLTNGSLLSLERRGRILKSNLDQICFSVHGINKKLYENTMHINYENTIENIVAFLNQAKLSRPQQYSLITFFKWKDLGEKEKKEAIEFWHKQGVTQISVFDGPISRAGNVRQIPGPRKEKIGGCNSIWTREMFHILYNGDVVLCCMDWRREIVLGNVKKQSIYDVWHSAKYHQLREQIKGNIESKPDFLCKRCESSA